MDYTLMHKSIPVVDMEILPCNGRFLRLYNLRNPQHLPVGIKTKNSMNPKVMDSWWIGRTIPVSRDGIEDVLINLKGLTTAMLVLKSNALSLSDQYWIKVKRSRPKWEKINFFQNDFTSDMGKILLGDEPVMIKKSSYKSPHCDW